MICRVASIVEGHGDREALPVLLRRIAYAIDPAVVIDIARPIRIPKHKFVRARELERGVDLAARTAGAGGAVLIMLDSDDDCPAKLGPQLLKRATAVRSDLPLSVVVAKREYEAWFLAAAESIGGKRGLAEQLEAPADPEDVRGAKEWLTSKMSRGRRYVETLDQPALSALFGLSSARRARSFDKFYREIERLIGELKQPQQP